jgi:RimJ/RimL family protein N-acetyltransferase
MELETARLLIRHFRSDDLPQYAPIAQDPDVMRFLGGPQSQEEVIAYVEEMIAHAASSGLGRYAVELKQNRCLIGFCGFRPAGDFIDLGYRFARHTWGQGIGLEAARAVRNYGLESLNMKNMEAGASVDNVASIKILDRLGFKHREEVMFNDHPSIRFRDQVAPGVVGV